MPMLSQNILSTSLTGSPAKTELDKQKSILQMSKSNFLNDCSLFVRIDKLELNSNPT